MPLTVLLALFSMLAQGTSDFIYKKAQERGIVLDSYLFLEAFPFAGVSFLCGYLTGDLAVTPVAMIYGPFLGATSFAAIFAFVTSLREGEVGVNTLIFRLNFILVAVMAVIWLGEAWTLSLSAGLLFAILAIGSVTLAGRRREEQRDELSSFRPIALALLAMVLFALLNVGFKMAIRAGSNAAYLIFFTSMTWATCSFVLMALRGRWRNLRNNWLFMPVTGSLKALAFFLMLTAFRLGGAASVVVPIVQLSFLVTIFLAALFLKERLDLAKLIGLGLAVGAIFMFSR